MQRNTEGILKLLTDLGIWTITDILILFQGA